VHEVAHIFHNCKRRTVGLPETRRREWLLDIAFPRRETFAYACEFYSWMLEHSSETGLRGRSAADVFRARRLTDDRVNLDEVADIVIEAAGREVYKKEKVDRWQASYVLTSGAWVEQVRLSLHPFLSERMFA
jgi:hypothetical protein